jgi:hypothetical protein
MQAIADGVFLTRDLVSEPPNVLTPAEMAERCKALEKLGVEETVIAHVTEIIAALSFKGAKVATPMRTREGMVREAARCFAAHILYLRRQAGDGSNPYTAEATRMETRLQRVADGLADLESAAGDADAVAIVEPSLTYSSGRLLL